MSIDLPEIVGLYHSGSSVRIPPADSVPLSPRVSRILDSAPMRRLSSISQLGLVSLVYPGATHSRLEHSLGVYHNALRLLARLDQQSDFLSLVDRTAAESFLLAALVHDLGHWPYCHPIEDMRLQDLPDHESRVREWIESSELGRLIAEDWSCTADDVCRLLNPTREDLQNGTVGLLHSCLSGPIDVDKLDYLQRDSLHAGVPYGRNFDSQRLVNAMTLNPTRPKLAIAEKGRTAAEMMVFARYVMFSEVYWHHAVRSATAMLQRAVFLLQNRIDLLASLKLDDPTWRSMLHQAAAGTVAEPLVDGVFGSRRQLYKRVAEFNLIDGAEAHQRLSRKPYWWLVACAETLAKRLSAQHKQPVHPVDVLIDAPPVKLEVDINMSVVGRDGTVRKLGDVSPVASALAERQFDDQVKRVRVFLRAPVRESLHNRMTQMDWTDALIGSVKDTEKEIA